MKQEIVKNWFRLVVKAAKWPALVIMGSLIGLIILKIIQVVFQEDNYSTVALPALEFLFVPTVLIAVCWLASRIINFKLLELRANSETSKNIVTIVLPVISTSLIILALLVSANLTLPILNLPDNYYYVAQKILNLLLISSIAWILIKSALILEQIFDARYKFSIASADAKVRQMHTRIHILRQIAVYFIGLVALAAALMLFDSVRRIGVGLFASAGILAAAGGLAAKNTLSSFVGGLQIAFTQPIKIGDAVVVETEYGTVEEITLTYAVIKIWDLRRLIVPINYFIEKPFVNYTRNTQDLVAPVYLYVDYHMPIEVLRNKFQESLKESKLWDRKISVLQVVDCTENNQKIRILVSAANPGDSWNLCCEIREKLIEYVVKYQEDFLPKTRILTRPNPENMK